jgi:hypothetical protein
MSVNATVVLTCLRRRSVASLSEALVLTCSFFVFFDRWAFASDDRLLTGFASLAEAAALHETATA